MEKYKYKLLILRIRVRRILKAAAAAIKNTRLYGIRQAIFLMKWQSNGKDE